MTFSDWSVIAELVSAIGVIVSLIYLAIQVRQNTKEKTSQGLILLRNEYLASMDHCTSTLENSETFRKGLNEFQNMPPAEQGVFHSLIHPILHGFHSIWESHKAGIASEDNLIAAQDQFISLLITPGGQTWWESFKHVPPPVIVSYIDQSIKASRSRLTPANKTVPWLKSKK